MSKEHTLYRKEMEFPLFTFNAASPPQVFEEMQVTTPSANSNSVTQIQGVIHDAS